MIDQFSITQDEMDTIETIIDKHSMADVMMALVMITSEKADHIRGNWQDDDLAARWDRVSDALISKNLSTLLNRLP